MITVSVLLFRTRSARGMCHMPVMGHLNPHSIAPLVTVIVVSFASYILTASLSNIVMQLALANLLVLNNEWV